MMIELLVREFNTLLGANSTQFDNGLADIEVGQGKYYFQIAKQHLTSDGLFYHVEGSLYYSLGGNHSSFKAPLVAEGTKSFIRLKQMTISDGFGVIPYWCFVPIEKLSTSGGKIEKIEVNDFTVDNFITATIKKLFRRT